MSNQHEEHAGTTARRARDAAQAAGREQHPAAMIGERATQEQVETWRAVGILKDRKPAE